LECERGAEVSLCGHPAQAPDLLIEQGRAQLVATALDVSKAMQARFRIPLRLIVIDTMLAEFDIRDWNDPAETRRVMNTLYWMIQRTNGSIARLWLSDHPAGGSVLEMTGPGHMMDKVVAKVAKDSKRRTLCAMLSSVRHG
jgi:hypothetical protein